MASNKKEITRQDVLDLVQAKAQDPRISMAEIFRSVDNVKPNYNRELWSVFWIPILFYLASVVGMLFLVPNNSWHRLSIIVFVLSTLGGVFILSKYEKKWWWLILVDATILYLIFSETLSMYGIIKLIEKII